MGNKKNGSLDFRNIKNTQFGSAQTARLEFSELQSSKRVYPTNTILKDGYTHFTQTLDSSNRPTLVNYYQASKPAQDKLSFVADVSASLRDKYFVLTSPITKKTSAFYYVVDGTGTAPNVADDEYPISISSNDPAAVVRLSTQPIVDGVDDFNVIKPASILSDFFTIEYHDFGTAPAIDLNSTGFSTTRVQDGDSIDVAEVHLEYDAEGNVIYNGNTLRSQAFDVYSGNFVRESNKLRGATDGTIIGNTNDRLRVSTRPESDLMDSFGRTRVVEPVILFESSMTYNKRPQLFDEKLVGTSSITHMTNISLVKMSVGTASGDKAIRQTRKYFRYQVARTHYKTYVGILGASKAGVVSRVGSFDSSDGVLFKQSESGLSVVRRDSTSGTLVDVEVTQANWNIDPLDGTGPSGITLDPSKHMIYGDKFNWHGGGPITMGIYFNGKFNACHTFETNNTETTPIMSLPNLPIRYEIENIAATASATSMYQGASSCVIDGGVEIDQSLSFSANSGNTTRTASTTTPIPVIALRPKATFEGRTNRTSLIPVSFNVQASDGVLVEIYTTGTIAGGTWTSVSSESTAEVNTGGTSITGGRRISSIYVPAALGGSASKIKDEIDEDLFIVLDIDGANPENIAVVVTSLAGSPTVLGSINWRESY